MKKLLHGQHQAILRVVSVVVILAFANCTQAIITGFLPGDACWGSGLTQATIDRFQTDKPVEFPYRRGAGHLAGCGYSGYWNLEVRGMPESMKSALAAVYEEVRDYDSAKFTISKDEDGTERRHEINPVTIMIYNKDYDLRQGIGLKFNEHWMKLVEYKRGSEYPGFYSPYVTSYRAVSRDWEISPKVPGLKLNEQDAKPWWGPRIDAAISVNADQVQILVLPDGVSEAFAMAAERSDDEQLHGEEMIERYFYRITVGGATRCHWENGNDLILESWPIDEAVHESRERARVVDEVIESLDRAVTDVYGIDETSLPADLQLRLEELRESTGSLIDLFKDFNDSIKADMPIKTEPCS